MFKLSTKGKVKEKIMNISKAATQAGLTVKTVRYYDTIGMVCPYQNPQTGYRDYSERDIAKLQFVGSARRFNFSIKECRELLSLYEDENRSSETVKALTMQKISDIEDRLTELTRLRDKLAHLASAVMATAVQIAQYWMPLVQIIRLASRGNGDAQQN